MRTTYKTRQDVVHTVHLIYVARPYGVLVCSTYSGTQGNTW